MSEGSRRPELAPPQRDEHEWLSEIGEINPTLGHEIDKYKDQEEANDIHCRGVVIERAKCDRVFKDALVWELLTLGVDNE